MNEQNLVEENKLRQALVVHFTKCKETNFYKLIYKNYPTVFENMTHNQLIEVGGAILKQAAFKNDKETKSIFFSLLVDSTSSLVSEGIKNYLTNATSTGKKLFTLEDLKNALFYGKYQL